MKTLIAKVVNTMPLLEERENGTYYTGPLGAGINLAHEDRIIETTEQEDGTWLIEFLDGADPTAAEWGRGESREEALRYALGAMFGPIDSEYDEARLQEALDERRKQVSFTLTMTWSHDGTSDSMSWYGVEARGVAHLLGPTTTTDEMGRILDGEAIRIGDTTWTAEVES